MNTKNLVILALLAGIGVVLHTIMPSFLGIKPDMMLAMMFLGILLVPEVKSVMLMGIVTGILSALTTSFPSGQIPNIIDKIVTSLIFFGLFLVFRKVMKPIVCAAILSAVGTLVSGTVFLGSALLLFSLPGPFAALFSVGVLPAIALNTVIMIILYPVAQSIFKRTKLSSASVIQK
ncbi:tryptophan transporter [Neobacillus sp. MM2021_6]|uniref:tryptophan transporter n=1 Tax=Bacillaceae TaxID=186817 RepID=UPI00140CFC50|nr:MULTISPECIES: tryptophan transporter [Bacillaceae]MBO0961338.1 tryptophan transporter [Neobacillus sp. MM2021_6]NHC18769.1 tryptophan transporter [Bacillus sp. MM2020_4]WML38659.1 tryptophan transporter [Neobacillus sp. OS1-2]